MITLGYAAYNNGCPSNSRPMLYTTLACCTMGSHCRSKQNPNSVCWILSFTTDVAGYHTMLLSTVRGHHSHGVYSPTRALRMALLMATTASSWPITLVCRVSSILISFSLSSLLTFSMGIPAADEVPVHQPGTEQLVEVSTCVHAVRSQIC